MKKITLILLTLLVLVTFTSCSEKDTSKAEKTLVFADLSWDSALVHNRIAAFIIENGYEGYKIDFMPGDTIPIINGLIDGDIDVDMESWHGNFPELYKEGIEGNKFVDLGENMPDAPQGWYVPRYLVEGDNALAPGLKSIEDLSKYAEVFKDPEEPSKGIINGGVAGWSQMKISQMFFDDNNLEETFNLGITGSGAALAASMAGAYKKGEAWIGYYWEPTVIMGKLDMVRLKGTEFERAFVNVLVGTKMIEEDPEIVQFLTNYATSVADNNEFLVKMDADSLSAEETAKWFIENKESVWTKWVTPEIAEKVKAAL